MLDRKAWRKLWKLAVPNKMRIFAWRFGGDSLPTHGNLEKKRVVENSPCPFCQTHREYLYHAIFECSKVASVWRNYLPDSVPYLASRLPLMFSYLA